MTVLRPATRPTIHFIGVTTTKSSIRVNRFCCSRIPIDGLLVASDPVPMNTETRIRPPESALQWPRTRAAPRNHDARIH